MKTTRAKGLELNRIPPNLIGFEEVYVTTATGRTGAYKTVTEDFRTSRKFWTTDQIAEVYLREKLTDVMYIWRSYQCYNLAGTHGGLTVMMDPQTIIFETKIVILSDGRLIHFSLSGCNNDNAGRSRDQFTAKIYTREEFEHAAKSFMENSIPYTADDQNFELKIGSRVASYYDYGKHLLRMLARAETYEEFLQKRPVCARYCTAIEFIKPVNNIIPIRDFDDAYHNYLRHYASVAWRRIMEYPDMKNEAEIVKLIEKGTEVEFTIGKRYHYHRNKKN